MFEKQKEEFKRRQQEISAIIQDLQQEEDTINENLKKIEDIEKDFNEKNDSLQGKPSFQLESNDLENISSSFIENSNSWIINHEKAYHSNSFFNIEKKHIDYSIGISLTHIGRLVSVCCEDCRKQFENKDDDDIDRYMYVEEA